MAYFLYGEGLEVLLDLFDHPGILRVGEIHLAGIHAESAAIVGAVHIFGGEMEMQVREFVAICAIIDFLGVGKPCPSALGHAPHRT